MVDTAQSSRRHLLKLGAGAAGAALLGPPAEAAASLSKAAVGYRDVPYNGKVCAQCVFFIFKPASGPAPASQCQLVAGNISPAGWCDVWAPKAV
jgi:hypothetical protein